MNLNKHEQLDLIRRIENEVTCIAGYVYPDGDSKLNRAFDRLDEMLDELKQSFYDENTYAKLRDRETNEIIMKHFEKGDTNGVCYYAAKYYAWSDCDDTYALEEIMCDGHELGYLGWQPGMLFEFKDYVTGEIVYSAEFMQWDH